MPLVRRLCLLFFSALVCAGAAYAQTVEATLAKMASEVAKNLPMMVNADVQATAVAASGKQIIYKYNVLKSASSINSSQLRREHYANSVNAMCSHAGMANLLRQGAILKYQFYDARNVFLFEISLTQRDCSTKR